MLCKPGIIQGNALSLLAGHILAVTLYGFNAWLMLAVLVGTSLVIGSACVFNNILDREMDKLFDHGRAVPGPLESGPAE